METLGTTKPLKPGDSLEIPNVTLPVRIAHSGAKEKAVEMIGTLKIIQGENGIRVDFEAELAAAGGLKIETHRADQTE